MPSAAPVARQAVQATAVRTETACSQPNTASVNSRSATTSRSEPRGGPDGPRRPPPPNGLPPKKASNTSPMPPNPLNGSVEPLPLTPSGPNVS